jgi:hypothetical protein
MPHFEQGSSSDWNCWPVGGEIDIMESTGGMYNNTVLGTYHWGANCTTASLQGSEIGDGSFDTGGNGFGTIDNAPSWVPPNCTCGCGCDLHKLSKFGGQFECDHPKGSPYQCKIAHDFSTAFHVFAVEWSPDSIRWFVRSFSRALSLSL